MTRQNKHLYEFGSFQVIPEEHLLTHQNQPVKIPLKTFELLLFLVQNHNQVISKEALMQEIWGETFVEDANLTVHISTLRKIFGRDDKKSVQIETFPKKGYRFVGEVQEVVAESINNDSNNGSTPILQADSVPTDLSNTLPVKSAFSGKRGMILVAIILLLLAGGAFSFYKYFSKPIPFQSMKITRISDTGKTVTAVISPDGKYVALAVKDTGKESIWLKNLATNSNVQLVAPKDTDYPAITFSKDGDLIYFVQNNGDLFQIPILGGESKLILKGVNSAISFSPEGRQFTFVRSLASGTALMVADADGSNEKQIAGRSRPEFFVGPAWSPDGKTIAVSVGNVSDSTLANIIIFSIEGGNERTISTQKWQAIWQPVWLSDGSGLIAPAIGEKATNDSLQIYFFPVSGSEVRRITNDLNNYGDVSLSANSDTLVTIRFEQRNNIWFLPQGKTEESRLVTNNVYAFYRFITAMPDGRIIYTSQEDTTSGRHLWAVNSDGTNVKQLTVDPGDDILPCATDDGRYIVFASNRPDLKTYHLWRMKTDGTEQVQLTKDDDGERGPICSPDGQTIYYSSGGPDAGPDKSRLWKISIDGGESIQMSDYPISWKDISPDGKYIALRYREEKNSPFRLGIISAIDGKHVKSFDIKGNSQIQWMPDGSGVSFIKSENGVSNIWVQPLNGEPPRQLTKFTAEEVLFFDWTKNGDLICTRGYQARDPVLMSNVK